MTHGSVFAFLCGMLLISLVMSCVPNCLVSPIFSRNTTLRIAFLILESFDCQKQTAAV